MYESFSVTDEDDIDNNHDSRRRSRGSSSNTRYSCMMVMVLGAFLGLSLAFFGHLLVTISAECSEPCVPGSEDIMNPKAHGTSESPVQESLRWGCDWDTADRICNYNRRYAEYAGYWTSTSFLSDVEALEDGTITFYDSGWKGQPVFTAPRDRGWEDWIKESKTHRWPSFRDSEVNWDVVRVLPDGETVSVDGTHLGHNLPDEKGNRYCINLVSIAGNPPSDGDEE